MDYLCLALMALFMLVTVWLDLKTWQIPGGWLLINGLIMACIRCFEDGDLKFLSGLLAGAVVMGFSLVSRGGVGRGDAAVVAICGGYIGLAQICAALIYSLIFCCIFGFVLAAGQKNWKNRRLIFTPFLLLGIIVVLGGEYLGR